MNWLIFPIAIVETITVSLVDPVDYLYNTVFYERLVLSHSFNDNQNPFK